MLSTYCFLFSPQKANSVLQIWRSTKRFCPNFTRNFVPLILYLCLLLNSKVSLYPVRKFKGCISSIVRYFPYRGSCFKRLLSRQTNFNEIAILKDIGQILAETTYIFCHILRLLRCCCARIVFLPPKAKQPSHESWLVYCLRFFYIASFTSYPNFDGILCVPVYVFLCFYPFKDEHVNCKKEC